MSKKKNKKKNQGNLILQILSIFLAVVLWFIIVQVENPNDTYTIKDIPIEAKDQEVLNNDNLIFYGFGEDTITVKFSGGKVNLGKLKEYKDDITATVDINNYYGSNHYETEEGMFLPVTVNLPDNIKSLCKVERQSSEYVLVKIDDKVTESFDVDLQMKNHIGDNYFVDEEKAKVLPQKVEVTGAKSIVNRITKAVADVNLSSVSGEIQDAAIKLLDKEGKIIEELKTSPEVVQVQVPVYLKKTVKLSLDVKKLSEDKELKEVKIEPSELVVAGSDEMIAKLSDSLSIQMDLDTSIGSHTESKDVILNEALYNVNNVEKVTISYVIEKSNK